jgi:hypothetical protein
MPNMLTALQRVKRALAPSSAVATMTHVMVRGGYMYATDGRLLARSPVDSNLEFMAPAGELESAMDANSTFELGNMLKVKTGRMRINIAVRAAGETDYPNHEFPTEGTPLQNGFLQTLFQTRKFMSESASNLWSMAAHVEDRKVTVTNNTALAQFQLEHPAPANILFPAWLIEFLANVSEMPGQMAVPPPTNGQTDPAYIALLWPDGTAVRGNTLATMFPPQAFAILDTLPDPTWEIPEEWRNAYAQLAKAVNGDLTVYPDRLVMRSPLAEGEVDIDTPVEGPSSWSVKQLTEVLKETTHIEFGSVGRAVWKGQKARGILAGRL